MHRHGSWNTSWSTSRLTARRFSRSMASPNSRLCSNAGLRGGGLCQASRGFVDVVDNDGVAFKLNFVVIPSGAFHVTTTVRICVMCQFYAVSRAFEGSFGLD